MKFDYGEEVALLTTTPTGEVIRRPCCIVGITVVDTERQVEAFGFPRGTVLYTVEFGDGSDRLVPEREIEPAPSDR